MTLDTLPHHKIFPIHHQREFALLGSSISLVIPAYNEASRLPHSLQTCLDYLHKHFLQYEVIVVDDGSTDSTYEIVRKFQKEWPTLKYVANERNRGKGYSVKKGMLAAQGDFVFFSDSDLSTPIQTLIPFLETLSTNINIDIIIGTRKVPEAKILKPQPWIRRSMGKVYRSLANMMLGTKVSDFTCGFKGFRYTANQTVFSKLTIDRWGFDTELLYIAKKQQLKVREVPVEWINSADSRVKIMRDTLRSFSELLRIRVRGWRGLYDPKIK